MEIVYYRYSSRTKSHSRSPNGHSPSRQSTSSASAIHGAALGATGNTSGSTNPSAVSRYYGRRREVKEDSSSLSDDEIDDGESRQHSQISSSSSSKYELVLLESSSVQVLFLRVPYLVFFFLGIRISLVKLCLVPKSVRIFLLFG